MAFPDIPGNPCQEVRPERPRPLGIAQEEDCVSWSKLVQLREYYNELFWDRLHECGLSEGPRYGTPPHREETAPLPTVEGCFRLDIKIEAIGTGADPCIWGDNIFIDYCRFMITGGTWLDVFDDPEYTYLQNDKDGPFYLKLQDKCYVCGKMKPTTGFQARVELECPYATEFPFFDDYRLVLYTSAPEVCNIDTDFGDKVEDFELFARMFDPCKVAEKDDPLPGCIIDKIYCCDRPIYGYYEMWENPDDALSVIMKLQVVRLGDFDDYTGILTPFIRADKLQEIKDRVVAESPHFLPNKCQICDPCGPFYREPCFDPEENDEALAFSCKGGPFNFGEVAIAKAVQGGDICEPCEDGFAGTICTCPWEELAQVMLFVSGNGCLPECSSCPCSCSSSSSSSESSGSGPGTSSSSGSGSSGHSNSNSSSAGGGGLTTPP